MVSTISHLSIFLGPSWMLCLRPPCWVLFFIDFLNVAFPIQVDGFNYCLVEAFPFEISGSGPCIQVFISHCRLDVSKPVKFNMTPMGLWFLLLPLLALTIVSSTAPVQRLMVQ